MVIVVFDVSGNCRTCSLKAAMPPIRRMSRLTTLASTGRRMKRSVKAFNLVATVPETVAAVRTFATSLKICGDNRTQQFCIAIADVFPRHAHAHDHQFARGDDRDHLAEMSLQHESVV